MTAAKQDRVDRALKELDEAWADLNDTEPKTCDCCERRVPYVRASFWHGESRICLACFHVWYDCGLTAPDEIKAYVLDAEKKGTFPFGWKDEQYRRVAP